MKLQFRFLLLLSLATMVAACGFNKVPKQSWSEETCPLPPDYSNLENWAAHPLKHDLADTTPIRSLQDAQAEAAIDIFFVHPTTLFGKSAWNGDTKDVQLNRRTERTCIKHQASIFNGVGRIYAPRYRQMVLGGFFDKDDIESNKRAYHTAYCDIKAAFEYYLAHENQGRPIMLVAHSQGSAHSIHLLKDYFDGQPLQQQLVAAYIPGWAVRPDTFSTLKPCTAPAETGCYTSWCSYEMRTAPKHPEWYAGAVCTNPVTWQQDTLPSDINAHQGTVMGSYDEIFPEAVQAQAHDGYLWVTRPKIKGSGVIRSNNFHIADFNLFWMDVRMNAALRAQHFLH